MIVDLIVFIGCCAFIGVLIYRKVKIIWHQVQFVKYVTGKKIPPNLEDLFKQLENTKTGFSKMINKISKKDKDESTPKKKSNEKDEDRGMFQ